MAFNYLLGHGFDIRKGKISIMSYDKNITGLAVGIFVNGSHSPWAFIPEHSS